jgi:hypothetical protein
MKYLIPTSCAALALALLLPAATSYAMRAMSSAPDGASSAEVTRIVAPLLADRRPQGQSGPQGAAPLPRRTPPVMPLPYLYGVADDIAGRIARAYTLDRGTVLLTLEPWTGPGARARYRDYTRVPDYVEVEIDSRRTGRSRAALVPFAHGTEIVWATTLHALGAGFIGPTTYTVRAWGPSVSPPNRSNDNTLFNRSIVVGRLD